MKIVSVKVEELFGHFSYNIELNDTVTIIHGPNGCGKTTLLKIIYSVFSNNPQELKQYDFKSIEFQFSDGTNLYIEKKKKKLPGYHKSENTIVYLAYTIIANEKRTVIDSFENSHEHSKIISEFIHSYGFKRFGFIDRLPDGEMWYDRREGETLTTDELVNKYGPFIYERYGKELSGGSVPEQVKILIDKLDVRLINADRLTVHKQIERHYGEDQTQIEHKVNIIAENVAKKIREAIQRYAQISQAKDRTFPIRAIKQEKLMSVSEIKEKMIELETKRKEFIETGILEEDKDDIDIHELVESVTENNRQNLSLYAIDTEEKLNALSGISSLINMFRKLIDNSFLNKHIVFGKEDGFHFKTTYSDTIIKPQNLSSGEQHELVMLYDLIFNTSSNTLMLIDEPELSLHIKWQIEYVDNLLSIIKHTGFSAILATHSPQIIHDKWNLTVSLSEHAS